jgi:homoserine O-acetyltransferase
MAQPVTSARSGSVGEVETQFYTFGSEREPFPLRSGKTLPSVTLAYETYGTLNPAKDNAVLIFHALSGSQHAAGTNPLVKGVEAIWTQDCRRGWWDPFIGSGKAFNTDHFFVVCANYLGGCYGSTGPSSIDPATGKPYAGTFPAVNLADIVDSQVHLLDHLGIDKLHAVSGGSLGGMLSMSLATRYPDRVRIVIPIASGMEVTSLQRIINFEQIFVIEQDPNYCRGDYYDGPRPESGMCLARMINHKTFVSLGTLEERARGEIVSHDDDLSFYRITHPIESYMLHQGRKIVKRFDANTYLRIIDAWNTFKLVDDAGAGDAVEMFEACREQRYLVCSIDSDVCFYPEEQRKLARVLKEAGVPYRRITIHSDKGHDAFLLEPNLLSPPLSDALEREWV